MRVIVDSSVLLRIILALDAPTRAVSVILDAALGGAFDLIMPPELVVEVADRLEHRPYFAVRVPPPRRRAFLALLEEIGAPVFPYLRPFPALTRDPKDDYLLAYALRDHVDFLVTGDRDLLDLANEYERPRIVDAGAFVRELRARGLL